MHDTFPWEQVETQKKQYAMSQLRIVRSDLHLVTYLNVGNCYDKSLETTLHEICVQVFLFLDFPYPASQANLYRAFTN